MGGTKGLQQDEFGAESIPFLPHDIADKASESQASESQTTIRSQIGSSRYRPLLIHVTLVLLYTAVAIATILSYTHNHGREVRNKAFPELDLRYLERKYAMMRDSPYIGRPSKRTEEAWGQLLKTMHLRVSGSELRSRNRTSVSLPGGGYLAWLGVYHELHCIKIFHQVNYREYYHPNITEEELRDLQVHADHCVDMLREAAMCHADVESLTTFVWHDRWEKPLLSPERPKHTCIDWDTFLHSLKGRIVDDTELAITRRPKDQGS